MWNDTINSHYSGCYDDLTDEVALEYTKMYTIVRLEKESERGRLHGDMSDPIETSDSSPIGGALSAWVLTVQGIGFVSLPGTSTVLDDENEINGFFEIRDAVLVSPIQAAMPPITL
jgi:3-oxoacyl-(acyl-carrier-protein) synthase